LFAAMPEAVHAMPVVANPADTSSPATIFASMVSSPLSMA
jgi:hypothetical protein